MVQSALRNSENMAKTVNPALHPLCGIVQNILGSPTGNRKNQTFTCPPLILRESGSDFSERGRNSAVKCRGFVAEVS